MALFPVSCLQHDGFPHSDILGSKVVCTSPGLFAAYRVLLRLQEPRHPPCALSNFFRFVNESLIESCSDHALQHGLPNFYKKIALSFHAFRRGKILLTTCQRTFCVCPVSRRDTAHCNHMASHRLRDLRYWMPNLLFYYKGHRFCGGKRIRTDDPLRARQVL